MVRKSIIFLFIFIIVIGCSRQTIKLKFNRFSAFGDGMWLTSLEEALKESDKITKLYLWHNRLKHIPNEIFAFTNLRELDLMDNKLVNLPAEISKLKYLETLNLIDNDITQLPMQIGKLAHLKVLWLSGNQLSQLPPEIGSLTNLKSLQLDCNRLIQLPTEFRNLRNLQTLFLRRNQFWWEFPDEILHLTSLQWLNLNENFLKLIWNANLYWLRFYIGDMTSE